MHLWPCSQLNQTKKKIKQRKSSQHFVIKILSENVKNCVKLLYRPKLNSESADLKDFHNLSFLLFIS